jgi:hypothetical protein
LSAALSHIERVAGKVYMTMSITGTPTLDGIPPGRGIAANMEVTIPGTMLKCGAEIRAVPEISVKYCIAETEMTAEKARKMVTISGGEVTAEPGYEYDGGMSSAHSGTSYPREPGPFYGGRGYADVNISRQPQRLRRPP